MVKQKWVLKEGPQDYREESKIGKEDRDNEERSEDGSSESQEEEILSSASCQYSGFVFLVTF